jgi:hypothetical protein
MGSVAPRGDSDTARQYPPFAREQAAVSSKALRRVGEYGSTRATGGRVPRCART